MALNHQKISMKQDQHEKSRADMQSELGVKLRDILEENSWSEYDIAKVLKIPQSRVSGLRKGNIDTFSFCTVVNIFEKLGFKVSVHVKNPSPSKSPKP